MPKPKIVINCHAHDHSENEIEEKKPLWDFLGYKRICVSKTNDRVERWIEKYPDYVIGLWRFDETRGAEQFDEARDKGFRGAKFIGTNLPYSDERFFPCYEKCQEYGFPILFHTGCLAIRNTRQENYRPVYLATICGQFPELYCIGAHMGLQWFWEAIMFAPAYERLYFDLSGGTWRNYPLHFFKQWFERVPRNQLWHEPYMNWKVAEKFVFGSDNPDDTMEFYINLLDGLDVPQDVQDRIYYKNACTMFGIDEKNL